MVAHADLEKLLKCHWDYNRKKNNLTKKQTGARKPRSKASPAAQGVTSSGPDEAHEISEGVPMTSYHTDEPDASEADAEGETCSDEAEFATEPGESDEPEEAEDIHNDGEFVRPSENVVLVDLSSLSEDGMAEHHRMVMLEGK
jgi:hypothetical protein